MKENELRKHARCDICKKLIGQAGIPLFWTVKIERHIIDMGVVKRQDGLTAMLGGNARLAWVMGTDEEMTKILMSVNLTVCELCASDEVCLAALAEQGGASQG